MENSCQSQGQQKPSMPLQASQQTASAQQQPTYNSQFMNSVDDSNINTTRLEFRPEISNQHGQSIQSNQNYFEDQQQMFANNFKQCWYVLQPKNNDSMVYPVYAQGTASEAVGTPLLPGQTMVAENARERVKSLFPSLLDETDMFYKVSTSAVTGAYHQQGGGNQELALNSAADASNGGIVIPQPQQAQILQNFYTQNNALVPTNNSSYFAGFDASCPPQHSQYQQQNDQSNQNPQANCQYQASFAAQAPQDVNQQGSTVDTSCPIDKLAAQDCSSSQEKTAKGDATKKETLGQKAKITRERNREHARSSRMRKKEYVTQLTALVQELHTQLAEEGRKRRLATQQLAEMQSTRCSVVHAFLRFLTDYESDEEKWSSMLEDDFCLRQPLTPFRFFPQSEVEGFQRVSRGIKSMINEAASLSVMVDNIGNRYPQCREIQAEQFLLRIGGEASLCVPTKTPAPNIGDPVTARANEGALFRSSKLKQQDSEMPSSVGGTFREVSSLSSRSGDGSSCHGRTKDDNHRKRKWPPAIEDDQPPEKRSGMSEVTSEESGQANNPKMVSSYGSESGPTACAEGYSSNDFHDYNAPALPDPLLDATAEDDKCYDMEREDTTLFSKHGEDREQSSKGNSSVMVPKSEFSSYARKLHDDCTANAVKDGKNSNGINQDFRDKGFPSIISTVCPNPTRPTMTPHCSRESLKTSRSTFSGRKNIADTPSVQLPPFLGLGKKAARAHAPKSISTNESSTENVASLKSEEKPVSSHMSVADSRQSPESTDGSNGCNDNDTLSNSLVAQQHPQVRAYFHINEDDTVHTDDVMMSRFIFRSQDAVLCGALSEVHIQGMLRAQFSSTNKLLGVEMIYDAMGFMQQLERASGNEVNVQVIPNSLEMAFSPACDEARAITLAEAPFPIISVNEAWTNLTNYTQTEVEGKQLSILHGKFTDPSAWRRNRKPIHEWGEVAKGRCACSMNIHFDKAGEAFIAKVCSYPLTK